MVAREREYPADTVYEDIEPLAVAKAHSRVRRAFQRSVNNSANETAIGFKEIEAGDYCTLDELKSEIDIT